MMTSTAPRLSLSDIGSHAPTSAPTPAPETPAPASTPSPNFRRGSGVPAPVPASEKQIRFLRTLVAERYPTAPEEYTQSVIDQGKTRVSRAINKLLALPKVEAPVEAPAPKVFAPRVNKFGGKCEECGTRVEAEQGTLTKSDEGKWEVAHQAGGCPVSEFPFPSGRYAVEMDSALHFFFATTEDGLFEQASDTLYPVQGQRATTVIAMIEADPEAASRLYGREIGQCGRCNRTLTDENSRAAGIGPVCQSKGWS